MAKSIGLAVPIKDLRYRCRLTQAALANILGVSQQTLAKYETYPDKIPTIRMRNLNQVIKSLTKDTDLVWSRDPAGKVTPKSKPSSPHHIFSFRSKESVPLDDRERALIHGFRSMSESARKKLFAQMVEGMFAHGQGNDQATPNEKETK